MEEQGLTRAELARDLGVTRARVSQMLNILKLPENILAEGRDHSDPMIGRIITEKRLHRWC
jgi:transcriptional regulator with XRE-family HTH domain